MNDCSRCGDQPAWNSAPDEWLCRRHFSRRLFAHAAEGLKGHFSRVLRGEASSVEDVRGTLFPTEVLLLAALVRGEVPRTEVPEDEVLNAVKIVSENWLRPHRRGLLQRLSESDARRRERDHAEVSELLVGVLREPESWERNRIQIIGGLTRYAGLAEELGLPIPRQFLPLYEWHTRGSGYDGPLDRGSSDPGVHAEIALLGTDSAMDLLAMGSFMVAAPARAGQRLDDFLAECPFALHRDIARWYEDLKSR